MYKVIFHLNEEERVKLACRNIDNLLNDMESSDEDIKVELLIHAGAVNSCKDDNNENLDSIKNVIKRGVTVAICNNTLNGLNISKDELLEDVFVVSSGVGELTRKQNEGWAYIKP
nr:DsrE family protein [Tissierella sp.]